jgi:hypothetical protein
MKTTCFLLLKIILIPALIIMLTGVAANGQDIIVQKNGDEIKAKVDQVLDAEIKYHKFDNLSGPLYSIKKTEVFMIKYENGTKDVFNSQALPVLPQTQVATASKVKITDRDIRPARTGAIISYSLIAPIMLLGTASAFSEDVTAQALGAAATLVAAVGIPIGATRAGKTRRYANVEGSRGLRITGWIVYGLTITDAITMLALSDDVDFTGGPALSVTVLGALSTLFFAIDANQTVREAKRLQSSVSLQPMVGFNHDMAGNKYKTIGFRINF